MDRLTAAVGVFDGVHRGHRALVAEVCELARLTHTTPAIFTFFYHPLHTINPSKEPPTLTCTDLKEKLLKEAGVQKVHVLDFTQKIRQMSAREFMRMLKEDYNVCNLVIGFNHRFGHDREHGFSDYVKIGKDLDINVVKAKEEVIEGNDLPVCSSSIRSYLSEGNIKEANIMLGRLYSISGTVVKGSQIGRTIGFPTANLNPHCTSQLIPEPGVYACMANINGESWPAMVNIGTRPTVGSGLKQTIEANIIDFNSDIYNKTLTLDFIDRIRDEKKFPDLTSLQNQLKEDRISTLKILSSIY